MLVAAAVVAAVACENLIGVNVGAIFLKENLKGVYCLVIIVISIIKIDIKRLCIFLCFPSKKLM